MFNVLLTETERKLISDRLKIEQDWGLEVYTQTELDTMTSIITKLKQPD